MRPYNDSVVTVQLQVGGLRAALDRLEVASADPASTPQVTFPPLFEALSWTATLDERIGIIWRPDGRELKWRWRQRVPDGALLSALAWTRNLVHHQWADAVRLEPTGHGLYPSSDLLPSADLLPRADHAWVWAPLVDLPERRLRAGQARPAPHEAAAAETYGEHFAGTPAIQTLRALLPHFEWVADLLEWPQQTSRTGSDT